MRGGRVCCTRSLRGDNRPACCICSSKRPATLPKRILRSSISIRPHGLAYLFMAYLSSGVFDESWWSDPRQDDTYITFWMWIFLAFNLHIFAALNEILMSI